METTILLPLGLDKDRRVVTVRVELGQQATPDLLRKTARYLEFLAEGWTEEPARPASEERTAPADQQTADEIWSAQIEASQRIITALTKGEKGVKGGIACPRCGGTMRFATAESNGHIHARCETERCLDWGQ